MSNNICRHHLLRGAIECDAMHHPWEDFVYIYLHIWQQRLHAVRGIVELYMRGSYRTNRCRHCFRGCRCFITMYTRRDLRIDRQTDGWTENADLNMLSASCGQLNEVRIVHQAESKRRLPAKVFRITTEGQKYVA